METNDQYDLQFKGVEITNVRYKSNQKPDSELIKIDLTIDARYIVKNENEFAIYMPVRVSSENYFELTMIAKGDFIVTGSLLDESIKKKIINHNAPAIIFPYIRAFISNFSGLTGGALPPLLIPIKIFSGELKELPEAEKYNFPLE